MAENGISKTRLYSIYTGIKQRCYNLNNSHYQWYGAKGITVCDEWLNENGLQNFIEWSLSHNYNEDLTIDRIDSTKGYSPTNCRWVTRSENAGKKVISHIKDFRAVTSTNIRNDLKSIMVKNSWTMTAIVDELNKRHGTDLTVQNFSSKLARGTLKYKEVEEILSIMGYAVKWEKE